MQIALLGRQPKLSLAELECIFGAEAITPISSYAALVKSQVALPQAHLGGSIKTGLLLKRLEKTDLKDAFSYISKNLPALLENVAEGKLQFGVSVYGYEASAKTLLKQVLSLKKVIKTSGRSVRIIENKKTELEAAQVLYNKLTGPLGMELLLVKDGADCLLAQTTGVQNIDDYSKRDFDRPKRDAFVGMLPPKLAQIMLNLAVSKLADSSLEMTDGKNKTEPTTNYQLPTTVLDPFCGTGVVLQEALLMGYQVIGSDISERMIEYTKENLQWLSTLYSLPTTHYPLLHADATTHTWDLTNLQLPPSNIHIVCETYLGKPLTSLPASKTLEAIIKEANTIAKGFLLNITSQLKKGTRLCLALPAWYHGEPTPNHQLPTTNYIHLPLLDHLEDLGYNRIDLKHATKDDLIYHRPDQIVARELTILEKI